MIVLGTRDDLTRVIPMLKLFQEEFSPWEGFSEKTIRNSFDTLVFNSPIPGILLIWEEYQKPVGLLVGVAASSLFCSQVNTQELVFFILPEFRKSNIAGSLLKAYEYWSKNVVKSDFCMVACMDERVGKLYERKGFEKKEIFYMKRMK